MGESIQAALDGLGAGGGWVVLDQGTHALPAGLSLPSGVTLSGRGRGTIVMFAPNAVPNPPSAAVSGGLIAIANKDAHLHDVVLRDFAIDCGATPQEMASATAPPSYGVVLASLSAADIQNIRIEHLSVSHCTVHGVHVKGAQNLGIRESAFTGNGGAAGAQFFHNLYIRRITNGAVENNVLSGSPFGNGLNLSYSANIRVACNEADHNGFRGLRAAETTDLTYIDNVTSDNGGSGLVANSEVNGCHNVAVLRNTTQHNGGYGIELRKITGTFVLEQNILGSNALGDIVGP